MAGPRESVSWARSGAAACAFNASKRGRHHRSEPVRDLARAWRISRPPAASGARRPLLTTTTRLLCTYTFELPLRTVCVVFSLNPAGSPAGFSISRRIRWTISSRRSRAGRTKSAAFNRFIGATLRSSLPRRLCVLSRPTSRTTHDRSSAAPIRRRPCCSTIPHRGSRPEPFFVAHIRTGRARERSRPSVRLTSRSACFRPRGRRTS